MGEVVELPVATSLDIPAERILKAAMESNLESVIVIGRDAEGNDYLATSTADGAEIVWSLELAKKYILEACS